MKHQLICAAALAALPGVAVANLCDHRPSAYIAPAGSTAVAGVTGAVGAAGAALKAAGIYVLTHAGSGLAMLGSTAGGASAAGTVGIMGGTAGTGALIAGWVLSPFVWPVAAAGSVSVIAYEGGCHLWGD